MDVSGLEDEYRLSAGKPRLIYVKAVPEREPRLKRLLDAIRAEAGTSYHHFRDADELRRLVADDLALLLTERFATTAMPLSGEPPAAPLPMPRRPLVNRGHELQTVTGLLQQAGVSLVTLTGPGGVGKTALALAAANTVADRFADGAAFLSLETLTDPALLRGTVVHQLRIPTPPGLAGRQPARLLPPASAAGVDRQRGAAGCGSTAGRADPGGGARLKGARH
jgi:hypothetical protein